MIDMIIELTRYCTLVSSDDDDRVRRISGWIWDVSGGGAVVERG